MTRNPLLKTDYYKTIHHMAYVPGMDYLVSYWTPRKSRIKNIDKVVCFGVQAMIKKYLIEEFNEGFFNRPWKEVEAEYKRVIAHTMNEQASDVTEMKKLHDLGYLPIQICCVPEGTRVNIKTPMMEITNTVAGFGWLVNYLETYLSVNIWYPMTTATTAYRFREIVNEYYDKTVSDGISRATACGDFSMRGMTSIESAFKASAGHLTSFTGTATIGSILWLEDFYNCDCTVETVGKGVPSTEHSVMSSYGRENEFECYRHLIEDVFPKGPLSIVSDTYDYWKVLTNYLPRLKELILNRDDKIVIRGDSGDPIDIICGECYEHDYANEISEDDKSIIKYFVDLTNDNGDYMGEPYRKYKVRIGNYIYTIYVHFDDEGCASIVDSYIDGKVELTPADKGTVELLWEVFGGTINSKGYKVLNPHISAIYGDGITLERAEAIYSRLEAKGFAANNVTLGIGSYTYQCQTRDSLGFALKATDAFINDVETFIYKDPITDKIAGNNFKKSQKGLCCVYKDGDDILYKDELNVDSDFTGNMLLPVFKDSVLLRETSLSEIRNILHGGTF